MVDTRTPLSCLLVLSLTSVVLSAPDGKGEKKVALLTDKEIARLARAKVDAMPVRMPAKDRKTLFLLIQRQLRQERYQQKSKVQCRSTAPRGGASRELDLCQLYLHAETVVSRGYGGKVIGLAAALTDDSEWQQKPLSGDQRLNVAFDVYVKPKWASRCRPLVDGEVLTDRGGADGRGDQYGIVFRADSQCYVYIVQLDVTGRFYPLYPSRLLESASAFGKPIAPGVVHMAPPLQDGQPGYFHLDKNRGDESIYFLASKRRRLDIEDAFHYFEKANAAPARSAPKRLRRSCRPLLHRGPEGVARPSGAATGQALGGSQGGVVAAKWYRPSHGDMLLTRWFEHQ